MPDCNRAGIPAGGRWRIRNRDVHDKTAVGYRFIHTANDDRLHGARASLESDGLDGEACMGGIGDVADVGGVESACPCALPDALDWRPVQSWQPAGTGSGAVPDAPFCVRRDAAALREFALHVLRLLSHLGGAAVWVVARVL